MIQKEKLMKPRGPLMVEHRLIEKVLKVAARKASTLTENNYDPILIETIVDFIRTYADRTHHGKEEGILFIELAKKKMDPDNTRIMNELIDEHNQARNKVQEIVGLNELYKNGNKSVVERIITIIGWLTSFYPIHIKKEDDLFFPDSEKYFTEDELDSMIESFNKFDQMMIHEKYTKVYEAISKA
jgi:hemerythrin-like domain-containing protein